MSDYELKELTAEHLFSMVRLITAFGLEEFKDILSNENVKNAIMNMKAKNEEDNAVDEAKEKDSSFVVALGMNLMFDIANVVLKNLGKCEDEIYSFLASCSNLNKKQIAKLKPNVFLRMIIEIMKKEEFMGFFKDVTELLN